MAYQETSQLIADLLGVSIETAIVIIAIVSIWELIWTGIAMWKSAKKNHTIWFIIFLVINFLAIPEILYIFWFSKIKWGRKKDTKPQQKSKPKKQETEEPTLEEETKPKTKKPKKK